MRALIAAECIAFGALGVWLAVSGSPWWWLSVLLWFVVVPVLTLLGVRRQRRVVRLLGVDDPAPDVPATDAAVHHPG